MRRAVSGEWPAGRELQTVGKFMVMFHRSIARVRAPHGRGFQAAGLRGFGVVLAILSFIPVAACQGRVAQIDVNPAVKHQIITGWETTVHAHAADDESVPYFIDTLNDRAVNEIGINRVRLEIRSGMENARATWADYTAGVIDYQAWRANRYVTVNDNDDPMTFNWEGFHFDEFDLFIETHVLPMRELLKKRGETLFVNVCYVAFTGQIKSGRYIHDDPNE